MNCLENKSENQVLELSVATALSRLGVTGCAWAWAVCAWAWKAAPGRGHADIKCCFAFSDVLTGF